MADKAWKRVIGLDLGTSCGYAWTDDGKVRGFHSGVYDLKPSRHEGGGMRFLRFQHRLVDLLQDRDGGSDCIVFYEEVRRHMGTDAAHVYGGLLAMLQSECEEHGIPYRGIPVGTIKKRATGRGNASKEDMRCAATAAFSASDKWGLVDENQADALWVLQCGLDELAGNR